MFNTKKVFMENKIIGTCNDKERSAYIMPHKCENSACGFGLTINKAENEHKYKVFHCEFKSEESIINDLLAEDIINMSADEFIKMLREASKAVPPNHSKAVFKRCKSKLQECNFSGPLQVVRVNTSTACNIKCKFCDITSAKPIYPEEKLLYFNILEKLRDGKPHLNYLQLTGDGEPFVYKKDTLDYIATLNPDVCKRFVIFTNCTLLNPEDIEFIYNMQEKNKIKVQIMCSCSAITPETYKEIHRNDNFYKVVENIKLINKYDMLQNINFVITPDNLHELSMYKQFWLENGVEKISATVIHDYCWPGATKFVYDSNEYKQFIGMC